MPNYIREQTADEARERAREKVRKAALRGEAPSAFFADEDLKWAFRGHEAELDELAELAKREHQAARERRERSERTHQLHAMTETVLQEWDAERRMKAETEARRRLGLTD